MNKSSNTTFFSLQLKRERKEKKDDDEEEESNVIQYSIVQKVVEVGERERENKKKIK